MFSKYGLIVMLDLKLVTEMQVIALKSNVVQLYFPVIKSALFRRMENLVLLKLHP